MSKNPIPLSQKGGTGPLQLSELLQFKRWNTPTIYNGWEQITEMDLTDGFAQPVNIDETKDYMPEMGPMIGYAVTVVCEASKKEHRDNKPNAWHDYRKYVGDFMPGYPKIVVVQDLDSPRCVGAFWGEVNSGAHLALGCVGTITDGAIRDVDEMKDVGFKALARRLCVGHAHSWPVKWGCAVEVFGRSVNPGQLIHADKHGFLVVPEGDEHGLLDAALFMDNNELSTVIPATRGAVGMTPDQVIERLDAAGEQFSANVKAKFQSDKTGEY
jgi:4-hydroxy-4-methyl-2-oxoglutarate aldolase